MYQEKHSIEETFKSLQKLKILGKHFTGHINITSSKYKFQSLYQFIKDAFDTFVVSESKLDSCFTNNHLSKPGY